MPYAPDRTIGERLRLRRKARGWSIRFAASRAGIAHSTWSRIEAGTHGADNRFLLADLARALECSISDLTGQPLPPVDRSHADAQVGMHAVRQALIDCDIDEDPTVAAPPLQALDAEMDLVTDRWRRSDFAAAAARLPDLIRGCHAAAAGPEPVAALTLMVTACYRASSIGRFAGHWSEAWLGAERCHQAAATLGDPVLTAWALGGRAHAAMSCGSYRRASTLAIRAVDHLQPHLDRPGALEHSGLLHLCAAFAAAGDRRGDDAAALLAEADRIADHTGDTGTVGLWFGPTNIAIWRVSIEADGPEPGRAVEIASRAPNVGTLDAPIRHATWYIDLSRALAHTGRGDGTALQMLLSAERLAPQQVHASVTAAETARSLLERASRTVAPAKLAGLCERLGVISH